MSSEVPPRLDSYEIGLERTKVCSFNVSGGSFVRSASLLPWSTRCPFNGSCPVPLKGSDEQPAMAIAAKQNRLLISAAIFPSGAKRASRFRGQHEIIANLVGRGSRTT